MACQTACQANVFGFDETDTYSWAYADTNRFARYMSYRYSSYMKRYDLAEDIHDKADEARPIRVYGRGRYEEFPNKAEAEEALQAHTNLPANDNNYDESHKFLWRLISPITPWSEHKSRSEMLTDLRKLASGGGEKVEIKSLGEDQPKRYDSIAEAILALEAPLHGAPDDDIQVLLEEFPHMTKCGMSRILAKYGGHIADARREFSSTPQDYCPACLANSPFLFHYQKVEGPTSNEDLIQRVTELVELSHRCDAYCTFGRVHCIDEFVKSLKEGMAEFKEDSIVMAAQRLWTSQITNCAGRELCGLINDATRFTAERARDEPLIARSVAPAACLARAINNQLVIKRGGAVPPLPKRDGFSGKCWRGGGLPAQHREFFELHKGKKVRIPNYYATAFKDGEVVKTFLERAWDNGNGLPCVKWEIELHEETRKDGERIVKNFYCTHVNFIEHREKDLPEENEFLFVPYSVFEIIDYEWSDGTPQNPHRIKMKAVKDNKQEDTQLPSAPWS